jgi:zinc D-Ala-D-Ala carboxypeptidase
MAIVDHGQFFSRGELQCRCGQFCNYDCPMDSEFVKRLDDLRERFGKPLKVTSGYRCAKHNSNVSSTGATGPHVSGKAIDFGVSRGDGHALLEIAMSMGFSGIGIAQKGTGRFIHLDDLTADETNNMRPWLWSY